MRVNNCISKHLSHVYVPDRKREDFTNDDPCCRSPGCGEEEDVQADEGNLSADSGWIVTVNSTCDGNDELANDHTGSTPNEDCAATKTLNNIE
jgi:hypothetical protein